MEPSHTFTRYFAMSHLSHLWLLPRVLSDTFEEREVKIKFKCLTVTQLAQYYGFIVVLIPIEHIYNSLNFRCSSWKEKWKLIMLHYVLFTVVLLVPNNGSSVADYKQNITFFIHSLCITDTQDFIVQWWTNFFLKWSCNQTSLVYGRHNVDFVKITAFVFVNISNKAAITF